MDFSDTLVLTLLALGDLALLAWLRRRRARRLREDRLRHAIRSAVLTVPQARTGLVD